MNVRNLLKSIILFTVVVFSSCATLLNSDSARINLITNQKAELIIENDTINTDTAAIAYNVIRSEEPLEIKVIGDSISKTVNVQPITSTTYLLNFFLPRFARRIDNESPLKFDYPHNIFIDVTNTQNDYLTYNPFKITQPSYILKIAPFSVLNSLNPRLEAGVEVRGKGNLTSQYSVMYLMPYYIINSQVVGTEIRNKQVGYAVSYELKYYYKMPTPNGTYLGLEGRYLNKEFEDIADFRSIQGNRYVDTFTIARQAFSINPKIGYQIVLKSMSIDCYAGLGLTYNIVQHNNRIEARDAYTTPNWSKFPSTDVHMRSGNYWTGSLPINIKIGWNFTST
mgnify:CR=1 FL=1